MNIVTTLKKALLVILAGIILLSGCGGPADTSLGTNTPVLPTRTPFPPPPTPIPTAAIVNGDIITELLTRKN